MIDTRKRLSLDEIRVRVCDIASKQAGVRRSDVHPALRLIEDLNFDSLAAIELLMELEDAFCVTLPDDPPNAVYKSVFTRPSFRLADLAELVYLAGPPPMKHIMTGRCMNRWARTSRDARSTAAEPTAWCVWKSRKPR
jgi:acyl carrier protein